MLPFNLVSIFGPSDIAIDAGSFPIIVSAVYTSSNKPANGKLKLSCTYYFNGEFTFEKNSATTGNTTFVISLAKDMKGVTTSQWDIYLSCNVQFTDDLTKKTTNDAKSITLHINKYTIEFFSQQNNIIEGFPYGFIMSVKRLDGSPIGLETKYEDRKIIVNKIAYYLNDKGEVETEIDIPFNTTFITIKVRFVQEFIKISN